MPQTEWLTDNSHLQPKDPVAYRAKLRASLLRENEEMIEKARVLLFILTDEEWDYFKRCEDLRREKERRDELIAAKR